MKIPTYNNDDFGWLEGTFDATIRSAVERMSKKGNLMLALVLDIINRAGKTVEHTDYVMQPPDDGHPFYVKKCIEKIESLIASAGVQAADELNAGDLTGAEVQLLCTIEEGDDGEKRTVVVRYLGTPQERCVSDSNTEAGDDAKPSDTPF